METSNLISNQTKSFRTCEFDTQPYFLATILSELETNSIKSKCELQLNGIMISSYSFLQKKKKKINVELNQSCETNQIKTGLTKSCESETEFFFLNQYRYTTLVHGIKKKSDFK